MFESRKLRCIWSGVSLLLLSVAPAGAQVRADPNRANDANTRVGSGGFNDYTQRGPTVTQNDIIYGNVTGGKAFHGPVPYSDPGSFAGPVGSRAIDRFIRNSAGVPQPYQPGYTQVTPQPFYGSGRYAPPAPGSVRDGFTGAYIGTEAVPYSQLSTAAQYDTGLFANAQPLGFSSILGTRYTYAGPEVGETYFQNALDSQTQQPSLRGSPLYGVRQLQPTGASQATDFYDLYGPGSLLENGPDRLRIDNPDVQRLRNDLQDLSQLPQARPNAGQQQTPEGQERQRQGTDQQNPLRPFESPEDRALNSRANDALSPGSLTADIKPQQNLGQRPMALTAQQLSAQYNELAVRLQRYQTPQMAAIQAAHDEQQAAQQAVKSRGTPGREAASQPAGGVQIGAGVRPVAPLKVASLADGVRVTRLHDLLQAAENDMRTGDFQKAIDKYNTAYQALAGGKVAVNPSLVLLGRGTAQLAAGFYRNANIDIHRALADRALLMGQFDIGNWMPRNRLDQIARELQELANTDKNAEMPVFLLAFISYNTGESDQADRFLEEARHRAGRSDPLLALLQRYWTLPQPGRKNSAEDLNK